jgi:hypothetical protein
MTTLLPGAFILILWTAWWRRPGGQREALLHAATAASVLLWLITDVLSFLNAITPPAISAAWSVACLLAWIALRGDGLRLPTRADWPRPGRVELLFALAFALLTALVTFAAFSEPNRIVDVMLYHLPRIRYWLQHQTVSIYPASYPQQVFMPPWSEYAGMHWMALSGSARGVGIVQVLAMLGSALSASLLARRFGLPARGQWIAAAFVLSIPQGLLEAFDIKNDYVCAFWIVTAVYFLLRADESGARRDILFAGAATGLALLTKSTSYFFLAPFGLWFAFRALQRLRLRAAAPLALVLLPILLLNGSYWTRNWIAFQSPTGCETAGCEPGVPFRNTRFGPRVLLSNAVRNLTLHFHFTDNDLNRRLEAAVRGGLARLGIDANDPHTTWQTTPFEIRRHPHSPEFQPNPWHLALAFLAAFALLAAGRRRPRHPAFWVTLGVLAGAVLFCALLRWQPWHTRLHLPLFVLAAPLIAAAAGTRRLPQTLATAAAFALLLQGGWIHYEAQSRHLFRHLISRGWRGMPPPNQRPGHWAGRVLMEQTTCRTLLVEAYVGGWVEEDLLSNLKTGLGGAQVRFGRTAAPLLPRLEPANERSHCALLCIACELAPARLEQIRQANWLELTRADYRLFLKPPVITSTTAGGLAEIHFGEASLPAWVTSATGFSFPEGWGRWTEGPVAEITFRDPLPEGARIGVEGYAFPTMTRVPLTVEAGPLSEPLTFEEGQPQLQWLSAKAPAGVTTLRLHIPKPGQPAVVWPGSGNDYRQLGLALARIIIERPPR